MKRILVLALTLPVFLVGCGSAVESDGTVNSDSDTKIYGTLKKVDVEGTTCVILDADGGGGALSCDWSSNGIE